jgi:nifR3 family TIM-barrel protein
VAGYTDRAFRSLCAEAGADLCFTDLVSAEAMVRNPGRYGLGGGRPGTSGEPGKPERPGAGALLIRRGAAEKFYAVQLFGAGEETLGRACALLAALDTPPAVVDLNAGCPVPKVIKTGAGSALMRDPPRLGRAVAALVRSSAEALGGIPITVKIRSGWDHSSINYAECARIAVEEGAALVSLHPRTRAQGYGGASDWSLIADLAARLPVPVAGSGDLYSPEDGRRMLAETGCAAIMFARGALGNPFIFSAAKALLAGEPWTEPERAERIAWALRHLEMLAAGLGEKRACLEMRKQFCADTRGAPDRPGIPGGAALRNALVRAETIAEYRALLA